MQCPFVWPSDRSAEHEMVSSLWTNAGHNIRRQPPMSHLGDALASTCICARANLINA